jgi:hypothetical protein
MKKTNLKRILRLKALQVKASVASSLAPPKRFTKEQFLDDCADNALIVDAVKGMIKPARFSI